MCNYFVMLLFMLQSAIWMAGLPKKRNGEGNDSADRFSAARQRRSISGDYFIGDLWASAE